jgi:hypothetical protein
MKYIILLSFKPLFSLFFFVYTMLYTLFHGVFVYNTINVVDIPLSTKHRFRVTIEEQESTKYFSYLFNDKK